MDGATGAWLGGSVMLTALPAGLGIFLGGAGMGSAAFGATVVPAPQQELVSQVVPQLLQVSQHFSLWKQALSLSSSLGPLQQSSHLGAHFGSQHFGAGAQHLGAGAQHLGAGHGAAQVSQHFSLWKQARSLSRSLGPWQSHELHVEHVEQLAPQQAPAAGAAAAVSPANHAVVTNRNAAFTRYTSNRV